VPALTACGAEQLEHDAAVRAASEIAAYLQEQPGRRLAAHLVGWATRARSGATGVLTAHNRRR
jgi:hypothetical protein